ncbi:Histone-lysine N-methyltransferase PRDM9 [Holothuria leucospilota]|uniref:Histone-lysine N-methyltransferase PRDM9 n=1 Tax=Holothuria leucospilota TaxID=206669 RepID=A0A9Q0YC73_HOLLE|nr:Histone-lysine N-methyltransferase PRDM9 [Holothuria leucospilota]
MECILCTLEKGIVHQQILDYVLQDGDSLKFTVEGNSTVYITGYTYRHPVRGDGLRHRGLTSALDRTAPNGLHSDLTPVLSTQSEGIQPRIIDEDLTEPEEDSLQERRDSEPADTSGVQEDTEDETDHQHNTKIGTVPGTMTEHAVNDQETDTSVIADTSSMIIEIQRRSDVEPHSQLVLSDETVNEGNIDIHGDGEYLEPLPHLRGEHIPEGTDQIIRKASISYELSNFENGQETATCQSSNEEVSYNITSRDTVEEDHETMQSISNNEVVVSYVAGEKVSESGDTETAVGCSQNQGENQDLASCKTDLKMRKVIVVLHRIDRSTLCSSDGWLDDCNGHQDGGNDGLCQVETGASEGHIERNISEKYISTHHSDIEIANLLLEMRSGEWTIPAKESSSDKTLGAVDWGEDRIDDSEKESQRSSESPDSANEVERPFEMGRQRSDVQSTYSCQKINEAILCVTVSPKKGPGSACLQNETADEHTSQQTDQKKLQKQHNRKEDLNSSLTGRQLRSATTPTKKNIATSLQGSAGNQGKSDPISTPRSFKNKRVLNPRKNITQSEVNTRMKVGNLKRKAFANDRKMVGKKLNDSNINDEKPFHCEYCEKKFVFQSYLLRHERSHTGEKPFNCKFCDKKFAMRSNVVAHERIHTGEYPFKCKFCERKFSCKSKMKYHENIHTGNKLFECKCCGKKFTMKYFLVCHERIHTGEKPFPCKYCEKRFVQKSQMVKHERTHTGEKPFSCRYCPKKFSVKSVLKYHERTHTGEKTFQCKYCGRMFTWRKNWLDHTKIHTGDRPFLCKFCGKKFFQKIILLQHEDTHTGERRFKCKYCKRGFAWKNNLMRHLRIHSGEKNDT